VSEPPLLRRAVNMRLNGVGYFQIMKACGYPTVQEAREAVEEYIERWFSHD
jgi:hypothetical protein